MVSIAGVVPPLYTGKGDIVVVTMTRKSLPKRGGEVEERFILGY